MESDSEFREGERVWVYHAQAYKSAIVERQLGSHEYRVVAEGSPLDVLRKHIHRRNENQQIRSAGALHELRSPCVAEIDAAVRWRAQYRYIF